MALPASPTQLFDLNRLYTVQEFMALSLDSGKRYELVRGELKTMSQPGGEHMSVTNRLIREFWKWVFSFEAGQAPGEPSSPGSFELKIDPDKDTVRAPDLTFIRAENIAKLPTQGGAVGFAPDLAVEIYSPNDRPGERRDKLEQYQQAGWELVWVIYPILSSPNYKAGTVDIYRLQTETGLNPAETLNQGAILSGEGLTEGFKMAVSDLFS